MLTTPTTQPEPEPEPIHPVVAAATGGCDPSYPGVCIPPGPPDLDCAQIAFRRFAVVGADFHGFDADADGIGCETPTSRPLGPLVGLTRCRRFRLGISFRA